MYLLLKLLGRSFVVVIFLTVFFVVSYTSVFAIALTDLEQQINLLDGEFSTALTTASPTDNSFGLSYYDSTQYTSASVYFEAVIRCDSCTGGNTEVDAMLYSDDGNVITTVSTTSSTYTLIRSGSLGLSTDEYTVRLKVDATSGTAYVKAARLIIDQTNNGGLTDTQGQIEIGDITSTVSQAAAEITDYKIYQFDADQFSGTTNAYFEATLKTNSNTAAASYTFDSYDVGEAWSTSPGQMVDANTATYASTNTDTQVQLLDGSTAGSTDLGEITTVEVRAFTYQENGTDGAVLLRPVFSGTDDGTDHSISPPQDVGNAAWSAYQDITTDTNAPSTWTWSDVDNLDLDVEFSQGASGTNTAYVSAVQVRITYYDNTKLAYAELYNLTNSSTVATVSTSNPYYTRVRSSALASNWDTTNDDEYIVRIYTANSSNTANLANAKIILDQNDSGGISETEVIQQQITSVRTQTNTVYTQDSFLNEYNPSNFRYTNRNKVYYEATFKTSGGTGYTALYNQNGSDLIDDPTSSEITTTATSYDRVRSSNLYNNTDWPASSINFNPVLQATSGQTTSVSNSWLVIQVGTIEPSLQFTVTGVGAAQNINGVTSTIATTITTIPFGDLSVASAEFGIQQLDIVTNDATHGYTVQMRLGSQMQGLYPANNFDGFSGSGATWTNPQSWSTPNGTSANVNTGWLGANTSDTDVVGWSTGSGLFGPVSTTPVDVMRSTSIVGVSDTAYVGYGIEANILQPPDSYSATLVYDVLPNY